MIVQCILVMLRHWLNSNKRFDIFGSAERTKNINENHENYLIPSKKLFFFISIFFVSIFWIWE